MLQLDMSFSSSPRRHRSSRTSGLLLAPNFFARIGDTLRRPEVLIRLAALLASAGVLWAVTGMGLPPFAYRTGDVPRRKIISRVDFQLPDEVETEKRRQEARRLSEAVYENNVRLLEEVRQELTNKLSQLSQVESFEQVSQKT